MSTHGIGKTIHAFTVRNGPQILTSAATAGVIATAIFVAKAAPRARDILDREEEIQRKAIESGEQTELKMGFIAQVKLTWRLYVPAILSGLGTVASVILSQEVMARRNTALFGAYTAMQAGYDEYKRKVKAEIGEQKTREITDSIATDRALSATPYRPDQVIITGHGKTLMQDAWTGRPFESSLEHIYRIANELNRRILHEGFVSLSEFYTEIGLDPVTASDNLGWSSDHLIEVVPTAIVQEDGTPCIVISFEHDPQFGAWYGH